MTGETLRAFHYHEDHLVAMIPIGEDPLEATLRPPVLHQLDVYVCPRCSEQVSIDAVVPADQDRARTGGELER